MRCDFEEDVSALFDGELRDEDAARVRAHVESCATCRELLDDFESVRESVRTLHPIEAQPRSLWRRRVTIPLPIAAAIALLLLGAPFVAFRRGEQAKAPASSVVRSSNSGLLAPYDGGGRAVITIRRKDAQ